MPISFASCSLTPILQRQTCFWPAVATVENREHCIHWVDCASHCLHWYMLESYLNSGGCWPHYWKLCFLHSLPCSVRKDCIVNAHFLQNCTLMCLVTLLCISFVWGWRRCRCHKLKHGFPHLIIFPVLLTSVKCFILAEVQLRSLVGAEVRSPVAGSL